MTTWRSRTLGAAAWLATLCCLVAASANAHQFAPALLALQELGEDRVSVRWKQPSVRVMGSNLQPVLPVDCVGIGEPRVIREGTGMVATWLISCRDGLLGRSIGVEGIPSSRADVLLRIGLLDGRSLSQVLTPEQPSLTVNEKAGSMGVFRGYAGLGVEHILTGWDHLLFVLGLVLLVGWGRRLLWTVTAFTTGHSLTLALAVLGLVKFPQAPIEAAIAASIYLLAVELACKGIGKVSLMERWTWSIAGLFGLLHGLGFAGALSEVGLPAGDIPLALFAFNVGIEVGQLLFVALVLVLWRGTLSLRTEWPVWVSRAPAYGIGTLAVFWFCERVTGILLAS
ncbi:MAG: HupE/UreJ family protein [bacterium]|nr:HupE/UreJ family protein [bacterium]